MDVPARVPSPDVDRLAREIAEKLLEFTDLWMRALSLHALVHEFKAARDAEPALELLAGEELMIVPMLVSKAGGFWGAPETFGAVLQKGTVEVVYKPSAPPSERWWWVARAIKHGLNEEGTAPTCIEAQRAARDALEKGVSS